MEISATPPAQQQPAGEHGQHWHAGFRDGGDAEAEGVELVGRIDVAAGADLEDVVGV
jgi:hypothetical protein